MANGPTSFHELLSKAIESEQEAREILDAMDEECIAHNNEPFRLSQNGEVLDTFCRAIALTKITSVSDEVRASLVRHDVLGTLNTIMECACILYIRDNDSQAAKKIDDLQEKVNTLLFP